MAMTGKMIQLGCTWDRSRLTLEGRTLKREFYDEEGNVIYVASHRMVEETGIDIDQRKDPAGYYTAYYRRVRRYRDGRSPRVSDEGAPLR